MNLWERNKRRRTERILAAAREMITNDGRRGLSMRALADEAGVSVQTIYNLIGGQADIVAMLVNGPMEEMEVSVQEIPAGSPLERLNAIVEVSVDLLLRQPNQCRAALLAAQEIRNFEQHAHFRARAEALLEAAIHDAYQARQLEPVIAAHVLARQIFLGANRILIDWAIGDIDDATFRAQEKVSLNACLMAVAPDELKSALAQEIGQIEQILAGTRAA